MANMLETIRAKQIELSTPLSAVAIEHFVRATITAALDMAVNAVANEMDASDADDARGVIDPERIVEELCADFTANVQQYWPAPSVSPDVASNARALDEIKQKYPAPGSQEERNAQFMGGVGDEEWD